MESTQTPRIVNLYTESNPNPNSLKFVANFMIMDAGDSQDYRDAQSATASPLALKLFDLPYVKGVFFMSNFVTVTKVEDADWYEIKAEVQSIIKEFLEGETPVIEKTASQQEEVVLEEAEGGENLERKIIDILDEYIKPAVEMDGGAISFHSFDEGTVKVTLQGSCSGCPSSTVTLKAGIENLLKRMVPEVKAVEAEGV